jgi:hypothetical protein
MRRFFSTCFATLALLAVSQMAQAQVFYTQDFSGGALPAGWSTTDGGGFGVLWEYCADPSVTTAGGCVAYLGNPPFSGTSSDNGCMVLDSDEAGEIAGNHISRLTTSAINCSSKSQVFATFENYIGIFAVPSAGNVLLKVSTNGTTWTSYDFTPGLTNANGFSANPLLAMVNISAVAANQATVYLQWEWTGSYEYWWFLDDVALTTIDPTPSDDLALSGFFYPASSFATPASQIGTDTFGFYGFVTNNGSTTQTNVKLTVDVLNDNNVVLYTDNATIASLESGYVDSLIVLPNQYAPELAAGVYTIRYTVSSDGTEATPTDNVNGDDFLVTASIFSKEGGPSTGSRPSTGGDYYPANLYQMSSGSLDNYKAAGFEFAAVTNPPPALPLQDVAVDAYLFRVSDNVEPGWDSFDGSEFLDPDFELKGLSSFEFPTGAVNYTLYPIVLTDLASGAEGVPLENGARYIACVGYTGASNTAFQAYDNETSHNFVSSILYSSQWYTGGFGEDWNPTIRMIIELVTSTDETPLPESALNVFPNPINNVLNLEVSFDNATDATITIADINGRVINIDDRLGLTKEVLTYQLPQLAAGTYLARIATKEGTKTKKFVVVK